jgi:outer membrane protein assembly factor BamB
MLVDGRYYKRVARPRTTTYGVLLHLRVASFLVNRPTLVGVAIVVCSVGIAAPAAQRPTDPPAGIALLTALDPRWTLTFQNALAAPAGFDREMAYVPATTGDLIAISLDDGIARWTASLPTHFTPATGDGLVFVAAERAIVALEQRSGRLVWRIDLASPVSGPPHWESGTLFVSLAAGDLMAIQPADGAVTWTNPLGSPLAVAPTTSQDRLYAALRDGRLVAIGLDDGETVWTQINNESVTGLLALQEQLLVGTKGNLLHSYSIDRGRHRWAQKVGSDVIGPAAADDDHIYFVAYDNVLRALARGNGNLRWTRNLPSRPSGGPVRMDHLVLVPFAAPTIGAYVAATGAEAFTIGAAGEVAGAPFVRENIRPTQPRIVAQSREGIIQSFAPRIEAPSAPLGDLPGTKVGG